MMDKQSKKLWKSKGKTSIQIQKDSDSVPDTCTSVDQTISPYSRLIPQMKGCLMQAKYYASTLSVNHYNNYTFVHLMQDTNAQTTLEAKNAYLHLLSNYGRKYITYHANNGHFSEKVFVQDTKDKG